MLLKVGEVLKGEPNPDWWDDISEEEREAIEKGLMEADKGNLVSNELVFKKIITNYLKKE